MQDAWPDAWRTWRTCAFCHLLDRDLIYYAMRHYAHGACAVEHLPLARLLAMKTHPLRQLPAAILDDYGYLTAVEEELGRRAA